MKTNSATVARGEISVVLPLVLVYFAVLSITHYRYFADPQPATFRISCCLIVTPWRREAPFGTSAICCGDHRDGCYFEFLEACFHTPRQEKPILQLRRY